METRNLSALDNLLIGLDQAIRTVCTPAQCKRPAPKTQDDVTALSASQRDAAARLMRVNHAGEVAAQALYRGHAVTARTEALRSHMERAAEEETDHLAWCEQRLEELGSRTSLLNPLWYAGSFAIGALAGLVGDKWSLGFVAETEHQVVKHLEDHLTRLPAEDEQSRAILEQMRKDEAQHATVAIEAGAAELPEMVKKAMTLTSIVMTRSAYWL
ncbi:MAG TPA: 2-polyprenyl-3-methyl-6-methoxy-1,4-benzoquinone monooxygenase [Gammaproteobacteria bacterium]|nr:2-polyprenyl-3-methyl-6-methoxy-1,4-benzoquinone monooxygenase [Gammaproteobacteria bacterium]